MGIIITKFKKKKSTLEILEKLENEIKSIEEFRRSTEQTQKKMVGRFIFISVCVYCITALILYFYFFPASAYERLIYIIPLIVLPILLILIKRTLSWYYNRKIRKNQKKLTNLKDEKKKILEEVMDKETYKVAKTILEKFAPEQVKKNSFPANDSTPMKSGPPVPVVATLQSQTGLRYRGQFAGANSQATLISSSTPKLLPMTPATFPKSQLQSVVPSVRPAGFPGSPLLLPRAILPRERSVLDKMVDYLVGDGPSNRYALICKSCSSHNGMALKEEFDYLSFRCCYCGTFNPARKKRPIAPKLDTPYSLKSRSDLSDSDRHSPSDTDSEPEVAAPIITAPSDPPDEQRPWNNEKPGLSDSDKLSDFDFKTSDTESSPMDIDTVLPALEKTVIQTTDTKVEDDMSVTPENTTKQD